jgi:hypothetical protein
LPIELPIDSGSEDFTSTPTPASEKLDILFAALESENGIALECGTGKNHAVAFRMQLNRARKAHMTSTGDYTLDRLALAVKLNRTTMQWEVIITRRAIPKIRRL